MNRSRSTLTALSNMFSGQVGVVANVACLLECPWRDYHGHLVSHAEESPVHLDWAILRCNRERLANPEAAVKASWVRPEDLDIYRSWGISWFKLAGRSRGENWVRQAVSAYQTGHWEGDLFDLMEGVGGFDPLLRLNTMLDNRKLNGFLKRLPACKAWAEGCASCRYCELKAEEAVVLGSGRDQQINTIDAVLHRVEEGSIRWLQETGRRERSEL